MRFLMLDVRVNPSAKYNEVVKTAFELGHSEIVDQLLTDSRVKLPGELYWALRNVGKKVGIL